GAAVVKISMRMKAARVILVPPVDIQLRPQKRYLRLTPATKTGYIPSMASIGGDALRGHLEALVLSTLLQGDAHGFEILRRLEQAAAGALQLKEGSLYPALYRLESAGLLSAQWEDATAGSTS